MIGTYLQNRYRIEAELGQGGMGTVYRADDTLLDRPVALKVLSTTGLGTEGRARLLREARAAARLNHPNIMAIYDAGEAGDASFIVMELLTGRTLREYQPHTLDEAIGHCHPDLPRAGARARQRHHPSRSETGERDAGEPSPPTPLP